MAGWRYRRRDKQEWRRKKQDRERERERNKEETGERPGKNSAHRENSFKDERPANDLFSIRKS